MKPKLSKISEEFKLTVQKIAYLSTSGLRGHSTVEYFSPFERETKTCISICIPNLDAT
jgi:hypothetical protein